MVRRMLNGSAVRKAFHARGVRVPKGFLEELERDVFIAIRRWADKGELGMNSAETAGSFVKVSSVKAEARSISGRLRVGGELIVALNGAVALRVSRVVERESSTGSVYYSVPSRVMRAFLLSKEHASGLTCEQFFWRFQRPDVRQEWIGRSKWKGQESELIFRPRWNEEEVKS